MTYEKCVNCDGYGTVDHRGKEDVCPICMGDGNLEIYSGPMTVKHDVIPIKKPYWYRVMYSPKRMVLIC